MDTSVHDITALFAQLGLDNTPAGIENFIKTSVIADGVAIENAEFWNVAQASFIADSLQEDSDWSEVIDQLDTMLRS
ncbi:hypothetical protein GCM10008107_26790 [Psychrosphaera saromensis]|jgi:hypothetical protein|uniref:DUF2789 domain-containing protein n=1 Tax=Psychrosphaera saromensis TaxID=716813 RepID=A0A2S7UVH8_9GAMM|nr:DUF2789 domain-containing protein [Psychrosphaera saromensis]PQJ53996.1 hypothetical protein BTO11_10225 [Psychrosphaera saromensis]GHB75983.1 hypothetical protein GCM10008107_26790 [Psychrosphaera saromensis]GLQ14518.1 hypothetical protein GCM10007917_19730 [Psychrosphaera saromensis]